MSRFLAVFVFLFLALPQAVAAGLPTTELVIATAKHRHTFTVELAANRQDRRMDDRTIVIDSDVGGATADVDQNDSELLFIVLEHGN